ncbi:MAG: hypothetical protein EBT30_09515, partial [Verrucomicrobia bacterium]|nr:hypothetical protein [Verrucomicrobiota bacterium]
MASREERSRSPPGALALPMRAPLSFDLDKMELSLDGQVVKVYSFPNDPEMPWFQAKPIVSFLGYKNVSQTLEDHVYPEDKMDLRALIDAKGTPLGVGNSQTPTLGYHELKAMYINEPALYSLIFGSRKEEAKSFKRWVCEDILPSIRRKGCYGGAYVSPGSCVVELSRSRPASPKRRKQGVPEAPAAAAEPRPLCLADAAGGELFTELVKAKCPGCRGRVLKAQCVKAYNEFVRLAAQDEQRTEASVRTELASSQGARAVVPEKWQALARAAVEASLASSGPIAAEGPAAAPASAPAGRGRRRPAPAPFVAEAEHGAAKDAANAL